MTIFNKSLHCKMILLCVSMIARRRTRGKEWITIDTNHFSTFHSFTIHGFCCECPILFNDSMMCTGMIQRIVSELHINHKIAMCHLERGVYNHARSESLEVRV